MSGEGREEVDGQIDVDTGAVADTLGRHAAAVGNDAQRFMPAGENLVGLGAVLAGDEPDSATALVERAVIQPGVGVMRQRTILLGDSKSTDDGSGGRRCAEVLHRIRRRQTGAGGGDQRSETDVFVRMRRALRR